MSKVKSKTWIVQTLSQHSCVEMLLHAKHCPARRVEFIVREFENIFPGKEVREVKPKDVREAVRRKWQVNISETTSRRVLIQRRELVEDSVEVSLRKVKGIVTKIGMTCPDSIIKIHEEAGQVKFAAFATAAMRQAAHHAFPFCAVDGTFPKGGPYLAISLHSSDSMN